MLMMKVWKGRSEKMRADHVDGVTQRRTKATADKNRNVTLSPVAPLPAGLRIQSIR
jgi:hypothetical protein